MIYTRHGIRYTYSISIIIVGMFIYRPTNPKYQKYTTHTISTIYLVVQTFKRGGTLRRVSFSLVYATVACVSNLFKSIQVFFVRHAREIEEGGHLLAGRVQRDRGRRRGAQDSHPAPPPDTSWTRCELTCTLNG